MFFYTCKVSHKGKLIQGLHEALVTEDVFETVQTALKKNSGRSETLQAGPTREYLLHGLILERWCRCRLLTFYSFSCGSLYFLK
jgi:hypothetical protein